MYFGKAINFRGNCSSGLHLPVTMVTESSFDFDVLESLGKFIFEFIGRVLSDGLSNIGVCQ